MIKNLLATASLGALLLAPAFAHAANTTVSDDDKAFAVSAAQGGKTEVMTSKMALKKSSNDQIKSFAQEMVDDHSEADKKLMTIAKRENIMLPAALDTAHQGEVDSLKKVTGSDFDKKYETIQEKEHNDAVTAFQREADHGTNTMLVSFAAKTLPILQHHVDALKAVENGNPPNATSGMMPAGTTGQPMTSGAMKNESTNSGTMNNDTMPGMQH